MTSVGPHWMTHALLLFFWPGRFVRKGGLQHSGRCCNGWTSGRSWEFCGRWYRVPHACLPILPAVFLGPGIIECQPHFGGRFQTMQICKYVWRGFGGICLKNHIIIHALAPWQCRTMGRRSNGVKGLEGQWFSDVKIFHPFFGYTWKINGWKLHITHLERKMIFQTCMVMFHVNLQGCSQ